MSDGQRAYSPREFLDRLRSDDLVRTPPLVGLVREPDDADDETILYAETCGDWTPIPLGMIDSIEHLDTVACADHTHPLVSIRLKDPSSEEGRVYVRLARLQRGPARKMREDTSDRVVVGGGGGLSFGGDGPIRDTLGGGYHIYWSVWCPEHQGFVEETYLDPFIASYFAKRHNDTYKPYYHHASVYRLAPAW